MINKSKEELIIWLLEEKEFNNGIGQGFQGCELNDSGYVVGYNDIDDVFEVYHSSSCKFVCSTPRVSELVTYLESVGVYSVTYHYEVGRMSRGKFIKIGDYHRDCKSDDDAINDCEVIFEDWIERNKPRAKRVYCKVFKLPCDAYSYNGLIKIKYCDRY